MKIAICEDDAAQIAELQKAIAIWQDKAGSQDVLVHAYRFAEDLLEDWQNGRLYDLLLLDIEFPYLSGFDLAKAIREKDAHVPIVFVTQSQKHMLKGYEVAAYRYILKPIVQAEIEACLEHCYQYTTKMEKESFIVQRKGFTVRIPFQSVMHIAAGIHAVTIATEQGQKYTVPIAMSFEKYIQQFPELYFVRCHRGHLINMMHIRMFNSSQVTLVDGTQIPIGRQQKERALHAFQVFFANEVRL